MKTVFPPAATVKQTTSDAAVYTGGGLITTIGVDPEGGACEITVRDGSDGSGTLLWNITTNADSLYRGQSFPAGLPFNKGIYVHVAGTGRAQIAFVKKS